MAAAPPTPPPSGPALAERARAAARTALASGDAMAARAAIAIADTALRQARAGDPALAARLDGLACQAGCAFCCHQIVGITPAEAALLAEAVLALPAPERAAIEHTLAPLAARDRDARQWWAERLPCPLLTPEGRCRVHAARPLPCRAYNSADADSCRRSFAGEPARVPVLAAQWTIHGHAQAGLAQALADAGRDPGPQPLPVALAARLAGQPPTA